MEYIYYKILRFLRLKPSISAQEMKDRFLKYLDNNRGIFNYKLKSSIINNAQEKFMKTKIILLKEILSSTLDVVVGNIARTDDIIIACDTSTKAKLVKEIKYHLKDEKPDLDLTIESKSVSFAGMNFTFLEKDIEGYEIYYKLKLKK